MRARALAIAAAALLVVVAVLLRGAVSDDGSGDVGGSDFAFGCIPELLAACAGGTSVSPDELEPQAGELDAWVTLDPLPAVVETGARRDLVGDPVVLAETEVVLAVRSERTLCTDWACGVSELDGRTVIPPPASASGLLALATAATSYFDGTAFARQDLDPTFRGFVAELDSERDPLNRMSSAFGAAGPWMAGGLRASLEPRLTQAAFDGIVLFGTGAAARAVVVPIGDGEIPDGVVASLQEALGDAGWDPPTGEPTNLPSAGVLVALREVYEDVAP